MNGIRWVKEAYAQAPCQVHPQTWYGKQKCSIMTNSDNGPKYENTTQVEKHFKVPS